MALDAIRGEVRDLIGTQYRDAAKESASQAGASEASAEISATNAKASETAAKASQTAAKTSETNAKSSETKAKTSETNAKTSETNAKASETKTKTSETKAQTSETNAKASEANAKTSETNAEESENISLEASAASILAATMSTGNYIGTGFPEGKVAAPVGSAYTDSSATSGAIRWIKTSGTGTTGWKVEYGDTGRINISHLMSTHSSSGDNPTLERIGDMVHLNFYVRRFDVKKPEVGDELLRLPPGFHPTSVFRFEAVQPSMQLEVSADGSLKVITSSAALGSYSIFSVVFLTRDSWPITLPGAPV